MFKLLFHSEHRNFQRLWWAQLISQFGDRLHQLALIGLIAERAGSSPTALAKILTFTILPVFLIQPIAGIFVDKWERRTTLFVCDLVRGFLVLLIPFVFFYHASIVPIYILVFVIFSFSRFYLPAKMSIIPDIVEDENLLQANSLITTSGMIAFVLGAAIGGYLVEFYGSRNGFIIDAGTFFLSAALLFSISLAKSLRLKRKDVEEVKKDVVKREKTFWYDVKEGLRYIKDHQDIRLIINTVFLLFSAVGAIYVVIIVFVQQSFQSITKDLGILGVGAGVGLFLGVLFYGKCGKKWAWDKTIFGCLMAAGIMLIIFAMIVHYVANLWVAIALAALLGAVTGPIVIAGNTAIHVVSEESRRGQVFSALEIVIHFAFLVAMLASSWLTQYVDEVWILSCVGGIFAIIGLTGIFAVKGRMLAQNE